jgi:hypothetical protein
MQICAMHNDGAGQSCALPLAARPAPSGRLVTVTGKHRQPVNVADRVPVEVGERLQRLADKVPVGTGGRVELGAVVLEEVKEPVELVADTDPEEVAAQAQIIARQLRVLRFLADADLVGQDPPFHWIVAVPALSDFTVRCTDLLKPY